MWQKIIPGVIGGVITALLAAFLLWAFPKFVETQLAPAIPKGAILAFNQDCSNIRGWEPYRLAEGRFILGFDGSQIAEKQVEKFGGSETVTLDQVNLPAHTHSLPLKLLDSNPAGTRLAGGDRGIAAYANVPRKTLREDIVPEPVANMPPYVVLMFCRKI